MARNVRSTNLPIVYQKPLSPIAEAFRVIRTNLQFASIKRETKAILVTSSSGGEGKSTTVCNLGVAAAQTGKRVLIVDADLRKPTVHRHFGVSNLTGLSNYILDMGRVDDYITPTAVPHLSVLPSGSLPPNPAELIESPAFWEMLSACRTEFDLVLVDSPPVLAVTDALILAQGVDGVVLVVNSRKTSRLQAKRTMNALAQVHARILGTILNRTSKHEKMYDYYTSKTTSKRRIAPQQPNPTG